MQSAHASRTADAKALLSNCHKNVAKSSTLPGPGEACGRTLPGICGRAGHAGSLPERPVGLGRLLLLHHRLVIWQRQQGRVLWGGRVRLSMQEFIGARLSRLSLR